jgi:hypothetical protein
MAAIMAKFGSVFTRFRVSCVGHVNITFYTKKVLILKFLKKQKTTIERLEQLDKVLEL